MLKKTIIAIEILTLAALLWVARPDRSVSARALGVCGSQYGAVGFCLTSHQGDSWCSEHIERERERIIELLKGE